MIIGKSVVGDRDSVIARHSISLSAARLHHAAAVDIAIEHVVVDQSRARVCLRVDCEGAGGVVPERLAAVCDVIGVLEIRSVVEPAAVIAEHGAVDHLEVLVIGIEPEGTAVVVVSDDAVHRDILRIEKLIHASIPAGVGRVAQIAAADNTILISTSCSRSVGFLNPP